MDSPEYPAGKSPRSLQGPRPAPLRVHKDSHKIRKPPVVPHPHNHHPPQQQQQQFRPPVIIYTVSPKVIHTTSNEFMNLVQRLTGPSAPSPTGQYSGFQDDGGAVSPAARFASIEKAVKSPDGRKPAQTSELLSPEGLELSCFPGILSPAPGSLLPVPANFFSPLTNDFFHGLSPVINNNWNNYGNNLDGSNYFIPSPSNLLSSHIISPTTPNVDLFHSLFDF
ncbi:protein MKS1-like [Bidens hawaiensis]|uniref:protein MKS1-like n=1 Tax=Bidens hawaiensis TaxID=980011 RepID=UPI00404A9FB3